MGSTARPALLRASFPARARLCPRARLPWCAPPSPHSLLSSRAPGCPKRAPCASPGSCSVRTPWVHRGPGTARRGGGGRRCCSVAHPIGLSAPAGGLGRKGGGPARRAEVAGPAGHCPRSLAASLRPLPAVLGGVRTRAQSPLRPKRRRTPGPAPSGATVGPADSTTTARGRACAARAPSSPGRALLCNFSLLLMGVVASGRQVLRARPILVSCIWRG